MVSILAEARRGGRKPPRPWPWDPRPAGRRPRGKPRESAPPASEPTRREAAEVSLDKVIFAVFGYGRPLAWVEAEQVRRVVRGQRGKQPPSFAQAVGSLESCGRLVVVPLDHGRYGIRHESRRKGLDQCWGGRVTGLQQNVIGTCLEHRHRCRVRCEPAVYHLWAAACEARRDPLAPHQRCAFPTPPPPACPALSPLPFSHPPSAVSLDPL